MLTPGRYVGAKVQEDDGEPFEEKMANLAAAWREQQAEAARLDAAIAENLERLGFGEVIVIPSDLIDLLDVNPSDYDCSIRASHRNKECTCCNLKGTEHNFTLGHVAEIVMGQSPPRDCTVSQHGELPLELNGPTGVWYTPSNSGSVHRGPSEEGPRR